jgi:hypothetical protein
MKSQGTKLRLLPPAALDLHRDADGRLVLTDALGRTHHDVRPVRAFPISDAERCISLCDAAGNELAWIEDPADLAPLIRNELEAEFAQREFLPVLSRIKRVSGNTEPCEWEVETDRGTTTLLLKSEDDVRRVGPHRVLVADAAGVRFHIPDVRSLDAFSRRIIERYLA